MSIEALKKWEHTPWGKEAMRLATGAQILRKSLETLGANKGLSLGENLGLSSTQLNQIKRVAEERLRTGHHHQAKSMFAVSAALGGIGEQNFARLGQTMQASGDYQGAVKAYFMAMSTSPSDPQIPFSIAQCLIAEYEFDAAVTFLERARVLAAETPNTQALQTAITDLMTFIAERNQG